MYGRGRRSDYKLVCTTRFHKFWVESKKEWIDAIDLEPGMVLRLRSGKLAKITGVKLVEIEAAEDTYNLVVEGEHNYFVGHDRVLVHNGHEAGPPPRRGRAPIGDDGHPIELHHDGQRADSELKELTRTDHRLGENYEKNHSNTGQQSSEIDRTEFNKTRREYWKEQWDSGRWNTPEC